MATLVATAAMGMGTAVGMAACGDDERGSVEVEGAGLDAGPVVGGPALQGDLGEPPAFRFAADEAQGRRGKIGPYVASGVGSDPEEEEPGAAAHLQDAPVVQGEEAA